MLLHSSLSIYCPEDLTHIVASHRKGDVYWGKIGRITISLSSLESLPAFLLWKHK